jgi:molecular chaperone DnaK (HSP70)
MTNNRSAGKKHQKETVSVKAADQTPTPSASPEVQTSPDAPAVPDEEVEQVDPLMAEVESFLSKRDELARKIAAEIETLEQKLAELKETATSLFPETAGGASSSPKPKKPKPKPTVKSEATSSADSAPPTE